MTIYIVLGVPISKLQYVGQSNNFRARVNGQKSDFRFYAAAKINKMDNKLPYDHLISHIIDYFHVCIVDMIHVGNNTKSQHEELLNRKESKWIWDLGSITLLLLLWSPSITDDDDFLFNVETQHEDEESMC